MRIIIRGHLTIFVKKCFKRRLMTHGVKLSKEHCSDRHVETLDRQVIILNTVLSPLNFVYTLNFCRSAVSSDTPCALRCGIPTVYVVKHILYISYLRPVLYMMYQQKALSTFINTCTPQN